MICQYCNTEISDDARFCPNCGNPAAGQPPADMLSPDGVRRNSSSPGDYTAPDAGPAPQPSAEKKNRTGLVIAIVAICFVLIFSAVAVTLKIFVINRLFEKAEEEITSIGQEIEDDIISDWYNDSSDIFDYDSDSSDGSPDFYTGKFHSLEDFVNSDLVQSQLKSQLDALEGTGISGKVTAEGNKLFYTFTIENDSISSLISKDILDTGLETQADTFRGIASMLRAAVDVENPVVVIRYLDSFGNEITSREFSAD